MSTINTIDNSLGMVSNNTIVSNPNVNIKKIEFIDGYKLDDLKRKAFMGTSSGPLISYGQVLNTIETRLYSNQPESILRTNIQKYMKEENLFLVELNDTYKFRPDLVSQIFYGTNEYFHLVLLANSMKSFLEFNPGIYNNLIFVLKPSILNLI